MGRSASDDDAMDGGLAGGAGLVGAIVDFMKVLEAAGPTIAIDIVADGGAAITDGQAQDGFDRLVESVDLLGGELAGAGEGMDVGGKEGFIHIDIAESGDEGLVEEGGLDGAARAGELMSKLGCGQGEGFRAEVGVGLLEGEIPDPAKTTRVAETKLGGACGMGVAKADDQVCMGTRGDGRIFEGKLAGHAQMDAEDVGLG